MDVVMFPTLKRLVTVGNTVAGPRGGSLTVCITLLDDRPFSGGNSLWLLWGISSSELLFRGSKDTSCWSRQSHHVTGRAATTAS